MPAVTVATNPARPAQILGEEAWNCYLRPDTVATTPIAKKSLVLGIALPTTLHNRTVRGCVGEGRRRTSHRPGITRLRLRISLATGLSQMPVGICAGLAAPLLIDLASD